MFGGMASAKLSQRAPLSALGEAARAVLGEQAWQQVAPSMQAVIETKPGQPILVSPRVLIFR
jgi:hypothetical protein